MTNSKDTYEAITMPKRREQTVTSACTKFYAILCQGMVTNVNFQQNIVGKKAILSIV